MKKIRPLIRLVKKGQVNLDVQTFKALEKKIDELVDENNRKNEEIRQIKKKLRVNAHFSRK